MSNQYRNWRSEAAWLRRVSRRIDKVKARPNGRKAVQELERIRVAMEKRAVFLTTPQKTVENWD